MTDQITNKYTFLPWVKAGLGALISDNGQGTRAKISVDLNVRRFD